MKVAIAQIDTRAGDFEATVAKMANCDAMAQAAGADLLVFPAPILMGCDPMALAENPAYISDLTASLANLSEILKTAAIVPFVSGLSAAPTPDAVLVKNGLVTPVSLGGLVSSLGSLSAKASGGRAPLAPLSVPAAVSIDNVDVGLAFTYDDLDAFAAGEAQADLICFIPFDSFSTDDEPTCMVPSVSDGCFVADAKDANSWIVGVNAAGAWEDQVFVGGSFVMAPWGELAAKAHSFTEDFLVCDIDILSEGPLACPVDPPFYDRFRILWDAAALSVRDQAEKRELDGVVVVADGSLASCATVALATDAVGPMRVHALVCGQGEALADARKLVRSLRIRDVDELSWRDLERAAEALGGEGSQRLASGLVQARLGAWAQEANLLVLSCADKTALAVGASDDEPGFVCQASAFAPLGDVYRSDVARIARHRNTVSPVIPPTALVRYCVPEGFGLEELAPNDELRLSELDAALLMHVERGCGLSELAAGRWGEERAAHLLERIKRSASIRKGGPTYPLLSSRGLVQDEAPFTDAWRDRVREGAVAFGGAEEFAQEFAQEFASTAETPGSGAADSEAADFAELLSEALGAAFGEMFGGEGQAEQGANAAGASDGPVASGARGASAAPGPSHGSMRSQISEVMGYLQGLSDGNRMRSAKGQKAGGEDIWRGYFSDN